MSAAADLGDAVRALASAEGFTAVGFAAVEPLTVEGPRLDLWLAEGGHAGMAWMARSRDKRLAPGLVMPGARTVAILARPAAGLRPPDPGGPTGQVSRLAWGRDYHDILGEGLRRIQRGLAGRFLGVGTYGSVDSRPVWERAWAARAGVGFAGHSCHQVVPGWGPGVLLAALLIDVELPPTLPLDDGCGTCARCLTACPTGALVAPGRLDARRCLSYLTIEHRGDIPPTLRPALGRRLFGCDACQEACPHDRPDRADPVFAPTRAWLDLYALLCQDDRDLVQALAGSPLRRAGAVGLKRNACVVLGNLGDPAATPALTVALAHPDPLVRRHAGWAAARCGMAAALALAVAVEPDPQTRATLTGVLAAMG